MSRARAARGAPRFPLLRAGALLALLWAAGAGAVPATSKTPGLESPRTTPVRTVDFLFAHHFSLAGDKLLNSPTFNLESGLLSWLSLGVNYASSSDIGGRVNEFEPRLKVVLLRQEHAAPLDVTGIAAYNTAGRSADAALVLARGVGPVTVLANLRGFSNGYAGAGLTAAAGLGLQVGLTQNLLLVGDVGRVLAAQELARIGPQGPAWAWSAGVAFNIPYSPHSLSLFVTNINTHTLEGSARGSGTWRVGFEFLIPFENLGRWAALFSPPKAPAPAAATQAPAAEEAGAVQEVSIERYAFSPKVLKVKRGTPVRWVNKDRVEHTATEASGAWDSGTIPPGGTWSHTFEQPGTFAYFCALHPFMQATLVVE